MEKKSIYQAEPKALRLEAVPEDLACPRLDVSRKQDLPLLATSLSGAVVVISALCGVLASIMIISKFVGSDEEGSVLAMAHSSEEQVNQEPQPDSSRMVPRLSAGIPRAPENPESAIVTNLPESSVSFEVPTPKRKPVDLIEWEELDFDSPFIEEPPTKTTATKKPDPSKDLAAKKLAEKKRRAQLAKTIAKSARLISRPATVYPASAKRKKLEGRAVVTVVIDTKGVVDRCSICESSGHESLDQAAVQAARKHRFEAAINGLGQPIASLRKIPITFKLR